MRRREYFDSQQRYRQARQYRDAGVPLPRSLADPPVEPTIISRRSPPPPAEPVPEPPRPPGLRLRIASGSPEHPNCLPAGHIFELRAGTMSIGRGPGSAVQLTDMHVSHHHADLLVGPGALTVIDNRSTNGTWVNDLRIADPTPLNPGDRVQIGHDVFVVEET